MHCLKRGDKEPQNSISSLSGQPLLVSSRSVSPGETLTRPNGFFSSRGPVSLPATTYGSRTTPSGSLRQPMIIGPATQILGGSAKRHDEDPEPLVFAAAQRTTRGPPRKASRWSHLPPIPTIREAAHEPDSLRGVTQYLAGTSSGTHPVATRLNGLNPSTRPQSYGPDTETRTRPASVTAAAEGSAGTAVGAHSVATASANDRDELLGASAPAGDAPSASETRTRTMSSTSSQFSLAEHPALGKTVSKPRATYARPGRLISGRGQPSA